MSLPTLTTPKYSLVIPSSKVQVSYRPFLVGEEKVLMIAQESKDPNAVLRAMQDVIYACTFGKINVKDLTTFDVEYIFLQLRSKSVGETVQIGIKCSDCKALNQISIQLDQVKVSEQDKNELEINLTDTLSMRMKYLTVDEAAKIDQTKSKVELMTATIFACMDNIYDSASKKIYPKENTTFEEFDNFVNSLTREQMIKIQTFISGIPKLTHKVEYTCCNCKTSRSDVISGAQSFFK